MSPLKDFVADNNNEDRQLDYEFALDDESEDESIEPSPLPCTSHVESVRGRLDSVLRSRRGSSIVASEQWKPRQGSMTSNISLAAVSAIQPSGTERRRSFSNHNNIEVFNTLSVTMNNTATTRRMSRTTQIINEEMNTVSMPEPSYDFKMGIETVLQTPTTELIAFEAEKLSDHQATGKIASRRGAMILGTTCFAQFVDALWASSVNIAVPHIAEEFALDGTQSWLISAYTLTFGGFLLLAGVLSDRYGRRFMFTGGMLWMTVFSIACGVSRTGVQCIIFRAMQGLGAAASVPSAIGVVSTFFVGNEKHRALSIFGAGGGVGFIVGLISSGIFSGTLGWRYIFYINGPLTALPALSGWLLFPEEKMIMGKKPSLDILGAGLGTSGIVLMTFALSQSEVSGWKKPVIVACLIVSIFVLLGFTWAERKVPNPIMPMHLWKLPSFAGIWCGAFLLFCWWASVVYYLSLIAQEVLFLTPLATGLYLIPMGVIGFVGAIGAGRAVEKLKMKPLLLVGYLISVLGTLPAAFVKTGDLFWPLVFPTSILCTIGIVTGYTVTSIALVSAVPPAAKSLAGGLINTAFQLGSGFGLAVTSVVYENVLKNQPDPNDPSSLMKAYQAALFTCAGLVGGSLVLTILTVRSGQQTVSSGMMVH